MGAGLSVLVVDPDDDYLGIDVRASNGRFAGTARIVAGLTQLGEFAALVAGFPTGPDDRRSFEFGTRDPRYAGGFVSITLRCVDRAGHAEVEVVVEVDEQHHAKASARPSFPVEAADIDRFAIALGVVERERSGNATLVAAV